MLKRKKQILLRQNETYVREADVPIKHDPTSAEPVLRVDHKLLTDTTTTTATDAAAGNGASVINGTLTNGNCTGNGHCPPPAPEPSSSTSTAKLPMLTPYENGFATIGTIPPSSSSPPPTPPVINTCNLEYCRLGCICDSISKTDHEPYEKHCRDSGDPDCIFGCICHLNDNNDGQTNGKRWTALRDTTNKYRQLRWWKDDDNCGFIPPGSQISLAHNEDGRPKRKSQPPERFRHGINLENVNLNRVGNSSNGYLSNGSLYVSDVRKRHAPPRDNLTNGAQVPRTTFGGSRKGSFAKIGRAYLKKNLIAKGKSSGSGVSAVHEVVAKKRIRNRSRALLAKSGSPTISSKFKKSSSPAPSSSDQLKNLQKEAEKKKSMNGMVHNPCANHTHKAYTYSITTGLPLSLIPQLDLKTEDSADGVLVNRDGIVVAIITETTDNYSKPTIGKLKYKREHTNIKKLQGSQDESNNQTQIDSGNNNEKEENSTEAAVAPEIPVSDTTETETAVEMHDADLSILLLPNEEESRTSTKPGTSAAAAASSSSTNTSSLPGASIISAYRFFELPKNYQEYTYIIYPELHALFTSNALQAKIKNLHKSRLNTSTSTSGDTKGSSNDPKIMELNSINLNQPLNTSQKANVYLLIDSKNIIIMGTIPKAFRKMVSNNHNSKTGARAATAANTISPEPVPSTSRSSNRALSPDCC